MRQPIDPEKIEAMLRYHEELKAEFKIGKLNGKMGLLMNAKFREVGIGRSTFWKYKKKPPLLQAGGS